MCLSSSPTAGFQPCFSAFGQEAEGVCIKSSGGPWIYVPMCMYVYMTPGTMGPAVLCILALSLAVSLRVLVFLWGQSRRLLSLPRSLAVRTGEELTGCLASLRSSPGTQERVNMSGSAFSFSNLVARQNMGIYGLRLGPSLQGWLEEPVLSGSLPFGSKTLQHLPILHCFSYRRAQTASAPPFP